MLKNVGFLVYEKWWLLWHEVWGFLITNVNDSFSNALWAKNVCR